MSFLLHYTSFGAVLHILYSNEVLFGNILYSNDKMEREAVQKKNDGKGYYTFCCSQKKLSSLMWLSYSKNKHGACLEFILKKGARKKKLLITQEKGIDSSEVKYVNNLERIDKVGFIKDEIFKGENEYRYLIVGDLYMRPSAEINWEIVDKLIVYVSSFFNEEIVKTLLESIQNTEINRKTQVEIDLKLNL